MAAEFLQDQAEGLRRLLAQDIVRIVTVTSGRRGVGKTSVVVNLAVALARRGKYVLVIDEHEGASSAAGMLGLTPHRELLHVIKRECNLEDILLRGPEGVEIVPAARGVKALAKLDAAGQEWIVRAFGQLPHPVDVVLVDAIPGPRSETLSLSLASQEVVLTVSPDPTSITDAYALIKVLNQEYAKHHFRVLVAKAKSAEEAQAVFDNMAKTASRFLDISLDFMGFVPFDEKLRQAGRLFRPVVDAFPSAISANAFRMLAEVVEQWPYPREDRAHLETFMQRLIINSRMAAEGVRF